MDLLRCDNIVLYDRDMDGAGQVRGKRKVT